MRRSSDLLGEINERCMLMCKSEEAGGWAFIKILAGFQIKASTCG